MTRKETGGGFVTATMMRWVSWGRWYRTAGDWGLSKHRTLLVLASKAPIIVAYGKGSGVSMG
jgi:hypothetical protein